AARSPAARLAQRLAQLRRHVLRDLLDAALERLGGPGEDGGALGGRGGGPARERGGGGRDGGLHVSLAGGRELADRLRGVHRIPLLVGLAGEARPPLAADEV